MNRARRHRFPPYPGLLAAVVILVLLWPAPGGAQGLAEPPPAPAEPVAVVGAFWTAFNAGDAEAALALYAEDAVIAGCCRGRAELRVALERELAAGRRYTLHDVRAAGETVAWRWTATDALFPQLTLPPEEGTNAATVREGKIVALAPAVDPGAAQRRSAAVQAALSARLARERAQATQVALATQVAAAGALRGLPDTQERTAPPPGRWLAAAGLSLVAVIVLAALKNPNKTP